MYLQNIIVRLAGRLVILPISLVISAVSVRIFGVEVIGKIGYMIAYIGMFAFFFHPGFSNYFIKNVAQGKDISEHVSTVLFIKLILVAIFLLLVVIAYFAFERSFM